MKYVGNATPSYPFGIKHGPTQTHFDKASQSFKQTHRNFRNSISFGPGPGSYNVHVSHQKLLSRAPVCTIGSEKRKVTFGGKKTRKGVEINGKFFGIKERDPGIFQNEDFSHQKKKTNLMLQNQKKKQILISTEERFSNRGQ